MALEDKLWRIAHERLRASERVVLCTLVASHGSAPREPGARMLVGEQGLLAGTVGGGCGEAEVLVDARKLIGGFGAAHIVNVDLAGGLDQMETQACGGTMDVHVELLSRESAPVVEALARAEEKREPAVVVSRLANSSGEGRMVLLGGDIEISDSVPPEVRAASSEDDARLIHASGTRWFVQTIGTREELIIIGSGHVAQPLARMAELLTYRVVVIDDRVKYANATNFPGASQIIVGEHAASLASYRVDGHSNIVIITRGHQYDEAALREALNRSPRYIGMIGSKRRALATLKRIVDESGDRSIYERVHSPIGLDIGAQTPEEIALAIMAEIVALRRGGSGTPLKKLRTTPRTS